MNDRNNIIDAILDALGSDGSRDLAERVYQRLRADGRVWHDDRRGLVLDDDIDYLEVAASVTPDGETGPAVGLAPARRAS